MRRTFNFVVQITRILLKNILLNDILVINIGKGNTYYVLVYECRQGGLIFWHFGNRLYIWREVKFEAC